MTKILTFMACGALACVNIQGANIEALNVAESYLQTTNIHKLVSEVISDPAALQNKYFGVFSKIDTANTEISSPNDVKNLSFKVMASSLLKEAPPTITITYNVTYDSNTSAWGHSASSPFDVLKSQQWWETPGSIYFSFKRAAYKGEQIISPLKLPGNWSAQFSDLFLKRQKFSNWFSSVPSLQDVEVMRKELESPNPIWRICIAFRLNTLSKLSEEDCAILTRSSSGYLDVAPVIYELLKTKREAIILKSLEKCIVNRPFLDGVSLACVCNVAEEPKALGYLMGSRHSLSSSKSSDFKGPQSAGLSKFKAEVLTGYRECVGYRVAYKIKNMLSERGELETEKKMKTLTSQALLFLEVVLP